jgi:hypothetical protein
VSAKKGGAAWEIEFRPIRREQYDRAVSSWAKLMDEAIYTTAKSARPPWQFTLRALFVFVTLAAIGLAVGMYWYHQHMEQIVLQQNRQKAELLVDSAMQKRHWIALETNDHFRREVVERMAKGKLLSQNEEAILPATNLSQTGRAPQGTFEQNLLARFAKPPTATAGPPPTLFEERIGKGEYHYYQPIFAAKGCVDCHRINDSNPNLAVGDMISIMHVWLPTE